MSISRERIAGASSPSARLDAAPNKILCVGTVCLDIVQTCREFPSEDSMGSSADYRWQRGGNASNTCTVLSLLEQPCEILACLSSDEHGSFLRNDLRECKIEHRCCPVMPSGYRCPVSTVILSLSTGSRTIVHHRANLPDLTLAVFEALDLEEYSWIHFEGRNLDHVLPMIRLIENYNDSLSSRARDRADDSSRDARAPIAISVELECARPELLDLLPHADVAFVAKDFAKSQGWSSMDEVMRKIDRDAKAIVVCAWAERGATARTANGAVVSSPAFPPRRVIDTLGAGDTFIAAVLYRLNRSKVEGSSGAVEDRGRGDDAGTNEVTDVRDDTIVRDPDNAAAFGARRDFVDVTALRRAITFACRLAGAKVGLRGYDGLDKACACVDASLDSPTNQ